MFIGQSVRDESWKTDRRLGATAALARLRVKIAQMVDKDGLPAVSLDDVLALIDEEMRNV